MGHPWPAKDSSQSPFARKKSSSRKATRFSISRCLKSAARDCSRRNLNPKLLSGAAHCAVHSLKDLPVEIPSGLTIGCIPAHAEVRDALISKNGHAVATLPTNASVGTSSLRRSAQLLSIRPDLRIESLRGNVDTRVRKALEGQYDAIILAGAGLTRLGLDGNITEWLPLDVMLPAPGQGALAVQCKSTDRTTLNLLAALDDEFTRKAVTAERAFLSGLGGGCAVPVAAHAIIHSTVINLTGLVISEDGQRVVKVSGQGADALQLGNELAQEAIARGADKILNSDQVK